MFVAAKPPSQDPGWDQVGGPGHSHTQAKGQPEEEIQQLQEPLIYYSCLSVKKPSQFTVPSGMEIAVRVWAGGSAYKVLRTKPRGGPKVNAQYYHTRKTVYSM